MANYKINPNSLKNLKPENGFKKGNKPWNNGLSWSTEMLNKFRSKMVRNICEICSNEYLIKKSHANLRRTCSRVCGGLLRSIEKSKENHPMWGKKNPSCAKEKNRNWKGGITLVNKAIRNSAEFSRWRTMVFKRDDYTCQLCFNKGGKLNADHIKPFSLYPELRFELSNGRTLCIDCHKTTDTYGSKIHFYQLNLQKSYVH